MLVDPSGQKPRQILQGRKIQQALHWSPYRRYLLLTLFKDGVILSWARQSICRLSDGALTSFGAPGMHSLNDSGSEWVLMGPGH